MVEKALLDVVEVEVLAAGSSSAGSMELGPGRRRRFLTL
jgi:hypothetical protein